MLRVSLYALMAVLLLACESLPQIPPEVIREGDLFIIPEQGVRVNGAEGLRLDTGTYQFMVRKPGHRDNQTQIAIDRRREQFVQVPLGQGYVSGRIRASQASAMVMINGQARGEGEFRGELDAGVYRVEVAHPGFVALSQQITIEPGQPFDIELQLQALATSGELNIRTHTDDALILINNEQAGRGELTTIVPFGSYQLQSIRNTTTMDRLVASATIEFQRDGQSDFDLRPEIAERLYEGQWLPLQEAITLAEQHQARLRAEEQQRYLAARISQPLTVVMNLTQIPEADTITVEDFGRALHNVLRVGDRVQISLEGADYLIWKRAEEKTAAFDAAIDSLWNRREQRLDYPSDAAPQLILEQGDSLLTTLAYQLHRRLNNYPILDLRDAMISGSTLDFTAHGADGELTLLVIGGQALQLNAQPLASTGPIAMLTLPAQSNTYTLGWAIAPDQVLVVSAQEPFADFRLPGVQLMLNEKQIANLLEPGLGAVQSFDRITRISDGEFIRESAARSGPLGDTVNLNLDELGPHASPGQYQRTWIISYRASDGGLRQRQIGVDYAVGEERVNFESDNFFRRPAVE